MVDEHVAGQPAAAVGDQLRLAAQRALDAGGDAAHPGVVRIGAAGGHADAGVLDRDLREAGFVEMRTQRGLEPGNVAVDGVAQLAMRARIRRHCVHRVLRAARDHRQHDETGPAIHLLGRREAGFAPVLVDGGGRALGPQFQPGQRVAHRVGHTVRGQPALHHDAAAPVGDAGERVGEHDGRVGGHAAPIAGMHAARAGIDHQVEMKRAAGAGGYGRDIGGHPRPVRRDQHVRLEHPGIGRDELAQAQRSALLRRLQHHLDVEAELAAALRQHRLQRMQVDGVLALVVGGAAAVPLAVLLCEDPRVQALAPLVGQPANRVAVTVGENGGTGPFHALRRQDRSQPGARIGMDLHGEAQPVEPRADRVLQIGVQVGLVPRVLRGGFVGDQIGQQALESAVVEPGQGAMDGCVTGAHQRPIPWYSAFGIISTACATLLV
jgi:hypothetical protein